uniref:Cryptochrome DASH n=1 Tax=Lingulaulax polyedra TaxID=160621 RepID=A0A516AGC5_LINPO|nr:cryptochrome DASH [Lingulodinium polyedra]|mmetsp:Transcript_113062/g.365145  ORF Transcript_113062/g.365145 Transcript_113062/m.365145 type:complete len:669 (+) Transcript_113062:58-2064(+)
MASAPAWKRPRAEGPVVWWLRNDLRLEDNPVARLAAGEALVDGRAGAAIFIFDPRFLDRSPYGRVTDPGFAKSIKTRRPVTFGNRKCCALRARFMLQCVRAVAAELASRGVKLHVCYGLPEEILGALPNGSMVYCQQEPVSVECTDVEDNVESALVRRGSALRREWGAMSLYHRDDLPFRLDDREMPNSFTELGLALGWDDIWSMAECSVWAAPVRSPVAAPTAFARAPRSLDLPGLLPDDLLADDAAVLRRLGYSDDEVKDALGQEAPLGGEPSARALLEAWLGRQCMSGDNPQTAVFWDLPVGAGPGEGHDPLQWANLARPDGWMRVSHYLAVGCISAREIFARAADCPNFNGVVHRLLWREWHRLNAIRYGRRLFWLQGPGWVERPWSSDAELAEAWRQGRTGVPYIDACMRELRQTGWLAYKGRKTTAYFLVFGLGIDWRLGAYHFEDTLLDYDCAMNYGNWVTVAAVDKPRRGGHWDEEATVKDLVEAHQSDIEWKLSAEMANDPSGEYIRRWVPELKGVAGEYVHKPWAMPDDVAARCGCIIGSDYPAPLMGPLHLSADEKEWAQEDHCASEDTERRIHPKDGSGRSYTHREFLAYAAAKGEKQAHGERLWNESLSVQDFQKRFEELEAVIEAKERELSVLRSNIVAGTVPMEVETAEAKAA